MTPLLSKLTCALNLPAERWCHTAKERMFFTGLESPKNHVVSFKNSSYCMILTPHQLISKCNSHWEIFFPKFQDNRKPWSPSTHRRTGNSASSVSWTLGQVCNLLGATHQKNINQNTRDPAICPFYQFLEHLTDKLLHLAMKRGQDCNLQTCIERAR